MICFHNPEEQNGYLSNWYYSVFTIDEIAFSSVEQYMMYEKAILFRDHQTAEKLVDAAFYENPMDRLSARTAEALYQEVSPYGATRLEQYSACAFAHFLRYGLQVTERQEYEFRALDLGNVMHQTLELFSRKLRSEHLSWRELKKEDRERLMEELL